MEVLPYMRTDLCGADTWRVFAPIRRCSGCKLQTGFYIGPKNPSRLPADMHSRLTPIVPLAGCIATSHTKGREKKPVPFVPGPWFLYWSMPFAVLTSASGTNPPIGLCAIGLCACYAISGTDLPRCAVHHAVLTAGVCCTMLCERGRGMLCYVVLRAPDMGRVLYTEVLTWAICYTLQY
eukprot:433903-Rhodomonas_salina.1